MNIAFTVCNRYTFANAVTLGLSYLEHHPDRTFYIGWVDKPMVLQIPSGIHLIQVTDIQIPSIGKMANDYYDFEMVYACRPWFAAYLLKENPRLKRLSFFSPTTYIFEKLDSIEKRCKSLLLTPNITQPLPKNSTLKDRNILNVGMIHAGSWILKPNEQTIAFIHWWANRTFDRAKVDLCNGMFLDQLWLNYALSWVEESSLIDHAGWHVGLHSLPLKEIELIGEKQLADEKNILTADFVGLADYHPLWSDHSKLLDQSKPFRKLLKQYYIEVAKQPILSGHSSAAYGKPARISPYRLVRRRLAKNIRKVISFIDQI